MLPAVIISFRETFEMFLIVFSFIAYVNKIGTKSLMKYIYLGIFSGVLSGILVGCAVYLSTKSLTGYAGDIFEGGMLLFTSVMMALGVLLMSRQNNNYDNSSIENKYNFNSTSASIFLIIYMTVFREVMEVSIYTLPLIKENMVDTITADFVGLLASFGLMILLYKTTVKLNISLILKILTIFLIFFGAEMFGEGLSNIFPEINDISLAGTLLYGIPLTFIFLKNQIKNYIRNK